MMNSLRRKTTAMIAAFAIAMLALPPATARAQGTTPNRATALAVPVSGAITSTLNPLLNGTFQGTANITSFAVQNGVLTAVGTIAGNVVNAAGQIVSSFAANFSAPVTTTQAACNVLGLTLGPLHLDLLGLVVDLNQVVLNITAQPGPGNLLGNLLCSVAGLLNNPGATTTAVANLLNRILGILAGV
jgi:hypothetical protein